MSIRSTQGTIGLELLEEVPELDAVLVTISGGGLSSGIATAVKSLRPQTRVYLVTPKGMTVSVSQSIYTCVN